MIDRHFVFLAQYQRVSSSRSSNLSRQILIHAIPSLLPACLNESRELEMLRISIEPLMRTTWVDSDISCLEQIMMARGPTAATNY